MVSAHDRDFRSKLYSDVGLTGSDLFGPLLLLSTYVLSLLLLAWERRQGVHTSPPAFMLYLLLVVCSVPTFKVQVEDLMANKGNR